MAGMSLEELMGNVTSYQQGSAAATNQIVALTASQAAISSADEKVYQQVGTDNSTVAAAAQAAALRTQAARTAAANAFHTNLGDVTEQITKYAAAADAAQANKDAALEEIARKDSVSLFDNPIEYIMNQFTINGDIARHNAANAQLESANARITSMNANTQTTAQTQNAISEPLTAASADAATRNAAATAQLQANKSRQEGLAYNINGIQAALTASKESLGIQFQALTAQNTQQQIAISLEHLKQSKFEFAQRQEEWNEKREDKAAQAQLGQSVVDSINRGRVNLGFPVMDDVNGKMVLAQLKGKSPLSQQMQKFYESGEASSVAGINVIGASPAAAASTLNMMPGAKLNSTQGVIKDLLSTSAGQVSAALAGSEMGKVGGAVNPAFNGLNPKDPATVSRAMNVVAQQNLNAFAANIEPGVASNPYQIPSINALGVNSPTVAALPVYKKVFEPLIKQGFQLSDPKIIVTAVGDAVAKGVITHKEALELSTIYHVGVKSNLAMRNLPGFGLTPSLGYRTMIETNPRGFTANEIVDLTQPDSLSRALVKRQSKILSAAMLNGDAPNALSQVVDNAAKAVFVPQPAAANALDAWATDAGNSVNKLFDNLPHAAPEGKK